MTLPVSASGMADSTHRAEVVPVSLSKHPNADSLSIVYVYDGGFQVVVRTSDWEGKDRGVYIQPDSIVPDLPEYAFLGGKRRIKVKRLRGEWSQGLLVPAPEGAQIGDDLAEAMSITHYEPPEPTASTGGECEKEPVAKMNRRRVFRSSMATKDEDIARLTAEGFLVGEPTHISDDGTIVILPLKNGDARRAVDATYPKYDVEAFRKYGKVCFSPGEPVWITEKIHGANGRWVFDGERMFAGSRTTWKREDANNLWWKALNNYPKMREYLVNNPNIALYGEVYGQVQDLKYGTSAGEVRIAIFDILRDGDWVDAEEAHTISIIHDLPWVPRLGIFPFDFDAFIQLAEGPSLVPGANNVREGIVVKPLKERWHPRLQDRICLKIVGNGYLERA